MADSTEKASIGGSTISLGPKKRPRPQMTKKKAIILVIIGVVLLFAWMERERRATARQLEATQNELEQFKGSAGASSDEQAKQVLEKARTLIKIPPEPSPTVATIDDVERLREDNEFFNSAENGDFLILTGNRAILYDLDQNIVIDVAPFRANETSPSPSPTRAPSLQGR